MPASSCSGFSILASFCFIATLLLSSSLNAVVARGENQSSNLDWMMPTRSGYFGTIADSLGDGEEFELDSESSRRILATSRYISYGALQRNNVPCSRRGASYYNCRRSGQANPYSRGCSTITRCSR